MVRVFIFPSCNEPGLEIAQALAKDHNLQLVGGSSNQLEFDPSRHLLDEHIACPWHEAEDFEAQFKAMLIEHKIQLVFPAWDKLVARFAAWRLDGVTFITPESETASLLLSKRATYARLAPHLKTPAIYDTDDDLSFPLFAKPDEGSGSVDAIRIDTPQELALARAKGLLVTEYLPGEEYTVDCLNDLGGKVLYTGVRRRDKIGRGIALGSSSMKNKAIEKSCRAIAKAIPIRGPWLAQFKLNAAGEAVLLEVNARVAGSMGLSRLAGVNIPLLSVELFLGKAVSLPRQAMPLSLTRHLNYRVDKPTLSYCFWDFSTALVQGSGQLDPEAIRLLIDLYNRDGKQVICFRSEQERALAQALPLPDLFSATVVGHPKEAPLKAFAAENAIEWRQSFFINGNMGENRRLEEHFPGLRCVLPDAMAVLG